MNHYTPKQKRAVLADACANIPHSVCSNAESCPICGVCTYFADTSDEAACELYVDAVKRGKIKEEKHECQRNEGSTC